MFFYVFNQYRNFIPEKRKKPLQVHQHVTDETAKRTSQSVSQKGSMTVEAALLLPVFLCALAGFLMMGKVIFLNQEIETALLETAKQVARQEYFVSSEGKEGSAVLLTEILFMQNMKQGDAAKGVFLEYCDFSGTNYIKETGEIKMKVSCRIKIPLMLLGNFHLRLKSTIVQKAWNGYFPGKGESGAYKDYVYITQDGEVYHKDGDCYHLHVTIREVHDTGKYYEGKTKWRSCEFCVKRKDQTMLFVTEEGDCYHEQISCSGLIRRISLVPLENVERRRPCASCSR